METMNPSVSETLGYYDQNADAYIENTKNVDK